MKIAIIGSGAFGIALSCVFIENTNNISMWTVPNEYEELIKYRTNDKVLKGIKIDNRIKISTNLEEIISNAKIIVIAIPVKYISNTIKDIANYITNSQHICIASKGIIENDCEFAYSVIQKYIHTDKIGIISGGTFAIDMANKYPMGLTIASKNNDTTKIIKEAITTSFITCEVSDDVIGVEICGAIKNILAIAMGILEGLNAVESTKYTFMTRCINDISKMVCSLGGKKDTVFTYAGIGDILLTCSSSKSRNFTFGKMIGEKASKEELDNYIENTTIEGLYTLKSMKNLLNQNDISMDLINYLEDIIYNDAEPENLINLI